MDEIEVCFALMHFYHASGVTLHHLAYGAKDVYRVTHAGGPDWVLRVFPAAEGSGMDASLDALTRVLQFLQERQYPAEFVVPTAEGRLVVALGGWRLLVTEYLGQSLQPWRSSTGTVLSIAEIDLDSFVLSAFGEALGRLHALPTAGTNLPLAGMLPEPELAWASERLRGCAGRVPALLEAEYQSLTDAVRNFSSFQDLPPCLVHNDCNFGNVVLTSEGTVKLVDWEGTGLGPALLDLGFVLSSCYNKQRRQLNKQSLTAILDGYQRHYTLTDLELRLLPDAIRFRSLVLLAGCFPERADGTMPDDTLIYGATYADWQAQYQASDLIAEAAVKVLT